MADIEPFYSVLGRRIARVRQDRRISQQRLGAMLDPPMTRASIANIEAGKQRVLAKTLVDIAEILDVPIEQLLPDKPSRAKPEINQTLMNELRRKVPLSSLNEYRNLFTALTFEPPRKPRK